MEFEGYIIEELEKGLFAIDDEKGDSMYLIIGTEKALLIDTCMMKPDIIPILRTLTAKPIELALTHAHIDHLYHADEFARVYLHKEDCKAWRKGVLQLLFFAGCFRFKMPFKIIDGTQFTPITADTIISLGKNDIRVIKAAGHTPGSCIFVDDIHQALFVGDAIGNGGASAWMWMPGCLKISEYKANLDALLNLLSPFENYRFLGGHRQNTLPQPDFPDGQPLNLQVVRDLSTLCSKMLGQSIEPVQKHGQLISAIQIYAYGTAGMWVTKRKIK